MSTRTILVTGAGRGIGRAIAVRLALSGWRVYGGVRTDVAAKELAAESELITPVELDVTIPEHLAVRRRAAPSPTGRVPARTRSGRRCGRPRDGRPAR